MSCCGGNCGCGSSCSCGNGCRGCKMFPDLAVSEESKVEISVMGVAAEARFFEVAEMNEGHENGGCKCGSNCSCSSCNCK
ncbi:unnamed protein product [Victoria cruziana]